MADEKYVPRLKQRYDATVKTTLTKDYDHDH